MSDRPFSSKFPRFKPRSALFRDTSPDTNDMFGFEEPSWTLPSSSRFSSRPFDSPLRSNMRPAFRSHTFDDNSFFRDPDWMDDDLRVRRGHSPMDTRRSPSPQTGSPNTSTHSFFRHNGGIPMKVKHEGSSRSSTPSMEDHEMPDSPAPAPGVEKHAGVTAKLNSGGNPQTAKRQPKVHHIPIRVEPRDEEGTVQHPTSTPNRANVRVSSPKSQQQPPPPPPQQQQQQQEQQQPQSPKTLPRRGKSTVHIIPTQVNGDAKDSSKPPSPEVKVAQPHPVKLSPMETTLADLENLRPRVERFKGTRSDKEYLYLDEMLTRHLIKLDNIIVDGNPELRQARKAAIKKVNDCIHVLERHVIDAKPDGANDSSGIDSESRVENVGNDKKPMTSNEDSVVLSAADSATDVKTEHQNELVAISTEANEESKGSQPNEVTVVTTSETGGKSAKKKIEPSEEAGAAKKNKAKPTEEQESIAEYVETQEQEKVSDDVREAVNMKGEGVTVEQAIEMPGESSNADETENIEMPEVDEVKSEKMEVDGENGKTFTTTINLHIT